MKILKYLPIFLLALSLSASAASAELEKPTRALDRTSITYDYTSGRSYNVRFEVAGVSYRYLTGSKPDVWWGPFPYQAIEVEKGIFLASWFEKGYGDYVTLLINFKSKLLYGSAILSGEEVHFHGAVIREVNIR